MNQLRHYFGHEHLLDDEIMITRGLIIQSVYTIHGFVDLNIASKISHTLY